MSDRAVVHGPKDRQLGPDEIAVTEPIIVSIYSAKTDVKAVLGRRSGELGGGGPDPKKQRATEYLWYGEGCGREMVEREEALAAVDDATGGGNRGTLMKAAEHSTPADQGTRVAVPCPLEPSPSALPAADVFVKRVATSSTTAQAMVETWEGEHGKCSRRISVNRDMKGKKVCHEEKRHYSQRALAKDAGNPGGNYLSVYLRYLNCEAHRVVCFDFDAQSPEPGPPHKVHQCTGAHEFATCALFQQLWHDGCLAGRTVSGCE